MRWRREGAIIDIEMVDNPNPQQKKQVKLMAIQDIRVARAILSELDIFTFIDEKFKKCPTCHVALIRDWGDKDSGSRCHVCQADVFSNNDDWDAWRRKELVSEYRRKIRKETAQQLFLFDSTQIKEND